MTCANCEVLQPPVTSLLLEPDSPLSNLFSNILNLFSLHTAINRVSHSHKTGNIIIVHILIFLSLYAMEGKTKLL
jgi:hypothetical protein